RSSHTTLSSPTRRSSDLEIPRSQFKMPARKLVLALNAWLPEDIRVMSATRCRAEFHARFDASGKQYRYFVWNQSAPRRRHDANIDRKSTRLNSSHDQISY